VTGHIHLDAYLGRIGYDGPCEATVAVLAEIQQRHVQAIPFENLDIQLGRPIRIDLPSIEGKLVRGGRGGYCFEHNTLLQAALTALGFAVTPLAARVLWQLPPDTEAPLTHMALMVEADGRRWLVDGGFGASSPTAPLHLDGDDRQPTPHEPRRIVRRSAAGYVQQIQFTGGEWADLYQFTLEPCLRVDYEVANWWTSTHPDSRFTRNLIVARTAEARRYTIFNREFTVRHLDGGAEKRELTDPDELLAVLAEDFGLEFPAGTRFGEPSAATR
jgi:N-hydroxyarylamine O-acetyltransferase